MIIADTSIWIEFLRGSPKILHSMDVLLSEQRILTMECIFGELLQGVRSNAEAQIIQEYWHQVPKVKEVGAWISAGLLSGKKRYHSRGIGLIDLAVLSATRMNKCQVWTLNKKLHGILLDSERFNAD